MVNWQPEHALVLSFPGYEEPAARFANAAGCERADLTIHRFPDGESLVRLPEALPEHAVFFVSLDQANRQLIELELAAVTAQEMGARRLTLVAPYLCYMRQDRAFHPGEAVSQRIIGRLLARRFDTLITVDAHLHRTRRLEDAVPLRRAVNISAAPAMAAWAQAHARDPLLVGPDEESAQWIEAIAAPGALEYVVARKHRLGDRQVSIHMPERSFEDRDVVLIDDIASTGRTLAEVARQVSIRGARSITVLVSHALFVDNALDCLKAAGVGVICSADSIPHPSNGIHLDSLLAEGLEEP